MGRECGEVSEERKGAKGVGRGEICLGGYKRIIYIYIYMHEALKKNDNSIHQKPRH
jgi:hypothetical protein